MRLKEREQIIIEYQQAYHDLHGRQPKLTFSGGWVKINGGPSNCRLGHLPEMTKRLIAMKLKQVVR